MIADNTERYGLVSRTFHWLVAFLALWQFLKLGDRIGEGEHWVGETLVPWHVSIGTVILLLMLLRTGWALSQASQRPPHLPPFAGLAKAAHILMYVLLLLLPVTGTLYVVGGGHGLKSFGVVLIAEGDKIPWMEWVGDLHGPIAWALLALIIGHILMALHHHFARGDGTLRRMA